MNNAASKCLACGQSTASKRSDTKYCSDRCRMRYKRKLKKIRLIQDLQNLCTQIPNHTVICRDGIKLQLSYNAKKGDVQLYSKDELQQLSVAKIESFLRLKQKEVNIYTMVNQFRGGPP